MKPIKGLYGITPEMEDTGRLLQSVRAALAGGVGMLQYRSKSKDAAFLYEQASELHGLCLAYGVPLIINDDVRLTDLIDAEGVHLGREDMELRQARIILGPGKIIGVSAYGDLNRALEAERLGADYVAFGSCFPSPTKPSAPRVSLDILAQAKRTLHIPVVAIGGIEPGHVTELAAVGIDAVAVISAIFDAPDITYVCRQFAPYTLNPLLS